MGEVTTMVENAVLAVGKFPDEVSRGIEEAAAAVGLDARFVNQGDEPLLASGAHPAAVVLPMDTPGAAETCTSFRAQTRLASIPVFGVARQRKDMAFVELFALGGDDLVDHRSAEALTRRLRALRTKRTPATPGLAGRAGVAVVASPDVQWRGVMGRALYAGGYSVRFVTNSTELVEEALAENVKVVVVADDLEPEGAVAAATLARARGAQAAWIVVSPPKKIASVHIAVAALQRAAVVDGFAPPENVLFRANELLARPGPDQRAAPRLLYGTAVSFRGAGRDEDDVGFSYNVSAGGVYVRTLAPLDAGTEVWLDMWAPRSQRRVRLAGTVAWRRIFGEQERATVPPGFGVKIVDGLAGDLQRWRDGCDAFAKNLFGDAVV
jgi:CheY-like chemotaxis protein/Tfp pilus assembly protein PilZ